jgi:hypothetical protein
MKQILTIITLGLCLLFSCKPTVPENTNKSDTLSQTKTDTAVLPVSAEVAGIDTAKSDPVEEPQEESQADMGPENFDYTFEGSINDKIKVKVNIFQYHRELKARAVYLSSKKIIDMDARYPAVGQFELTEKINGKPTGVWKIATDEEDVFKGTWTAPDGTKKMPISLAMSPEDFDNFLPAEEVKTGYYVYKDINEDEETKEEFPITFSEELYVKNMSGSSIYFDLYIQGPPPGVHVGMLSGMANKVGKNYIYKNDEGCEITMSFSGNTVTMGQKGADVDCGFGANIGAFGTLKKSNP